MTEYLTRGMYAFIISILMMSVAISCDTEDADTGDATEEHMGHDHDVDSDSVETIREPRMSDDQPSLEGPTEPFMTEPQQGSITINAGGSYAVQIQLMEFRVVGRMQKGVDSAYWIPGSVWIQVDTLLPLMQGAQHSPMEFPAPAITDQPVEVGTLGAED